MSKVKIITDSASDLSPADEQALDILVLPFPVAIADRNYMSRTDFTNEQFYELLEAAPEIPVTSQITMFEYGKAFEQALRDGYTDVINITINAECSGTYNSACLAAQLFAEEHPGADFRIHNVDGRSYTAAYGFATAEAARMARDGQSVEQILTFVKDWVAHCAIYFVPYTLKYAGKSGRIPSAAAFVGELVGLKPVLRIFDHEIVTDDKVRGEKKIIPAIVGKVQPRIEPETPYIILYGQQPEDGARMAQAMTDALGYPPACMTQIGAAIAINAGPRVVGVTYYEK